jgi:hypothetical protein
MWETGRPVKGRLTMFARNLDVIDAAFSNFARLARDAELQRKET